jgi:hypothetical protein
MGMGILVASRGPCLEHKCFWLREDARAAAVVRTEHGMTGRCRAVMARPPGAAYVSRRGAERAGGEVGSWR